MPGAEPEFCEAPSPLEYSDPHTYSSTGAGYRCCQKEWDMAWGDDTVWLHAYWRQWFDSTIMTYGPADIANGLDNQVWDNATPINGTSFRAPVGVEIRLLEAQNGWCSGATTYGIDRHCSIATGFIQPVHDEVR